MTQSTIQHIADLVCHARFAIALTGAGISTPSGIPDFRGSSGLWGDAESMEATSLFGFKHDPCRFYRWIAPLAKAMYAAQPNHAHLALTELETLGMLSAIITQNVDTLHTKAGSSVVHELHGHIRSATCISCFKTYPADASLVAEIAENCVPRCEACHGVLKPDIILFGEQLPVKPLIAARQAVQQCDLLIIAGSSLEVAPVSNLPRIASQHGAHIVIINNEPTTMDTEADSLLHANIEVVLPLIAEAVRKATRQ